MAKERLDHLLARKHPELSRSFIQSMIMQGKVRVNGHAVTKPGTMIKSDTVIELIDDRPQYVSRAGFKLAHALAFFTLDVDGLVALDAGLSTGGFTDCLLQHGAQKVYGIDVGYGQVHEKIATDPRVVVMERTNIRHLKNLPELVDVVTLDLSFISVLKVIPAVIPFVKPGGTVIILIKPQFEAGKNEVGRGGIIKDQAIHDSVIRNIADECEKKGLVFKGVTPSPLKGADGNQEFLALFIKQ